MKCKRKSINEEKKAKQNLVDSNKIKNSG